MKINKKKKLFILFSNDGEFYYKTRTSAEKGQVIHGGYISRDKLFHNQKLSLEVGLWAKMSF